MIHDMFPSKYHAVFESIDFSIFIFVQNFFLIPCILSLLVEIFDMYSILSLILFYSIQTICMLSTKYFVNLF